MSHCYRCGSAVGGNRWGCYACEEWPQQPYGRWVARIGSWLIRFGARIGGTP